jgi:hypothetical protein
MPGSPGTAPAPDLPPGPRHALAVATTAYTDPGLSQLRAPARDATDLAKVLADPQIGGFTVTSAINKPASDTGRSIDCMAFGPRGGMLPVAEATKVMLKPSEQFTLLASRDAAVRIWT